MPTKTVYVLLLVLLAALGCEKTVEENEKAAESANDLLTCMDDYHRVLRPLMHQALPEKNVAAFKDNSGKLHECAERLVSAVIPEKYAEQKTEIAGLVQEILDTTKTFANDCQTGSDEKILASFLVAHDKYEALADIVYRL
ncbi:hypothetical protein MJD09_15375 [bacterium]|nr:hypothetical protein [bacterium]